MGCEGTTPDAARRVRAIEDPTAAGRLLRRRYRCPAARSHPIGRNHPDLVASHPGRAHRGRLQRPHRGLQPDHQTNQASRLRLPQHDQLPAPYPEPHCGHPTAEISSMNGTNPAEIRKAGFTVETPGRPAHQARPPPQPRTIKINYATPEGWSVDRG